MIVQLTFLPHHHRVRKTCTKERESSEKKSDLFLKWNTEFILETKIYARERTCVRTPVHEMSKMSAKNGKMKQVGEMCARFSHSLECVSSVLDC